MRILLADKLSSTVSDQLEEVGCAVSLDPTLQGDALTEALRLHDPQVLVVRSTKIQAEHIQAAASLALIIRAGAGVNTIDLAAASGRGIYVANCPGKNAVAVAELTLGHLLNLDRRIADNVIALREGRWAKKEFSRARGLKGRTIAVLGTGQIGQEVIRRALAFGMTVRAWSRSLTAEQARAMGAVFAATPRQAARGAHALTVHVALNAETRGLVGPEVLEALAPGAYVINTSRGGIVDEAALVRALKTRGLRAGLDVFEEEPSSGSTFTSAIAAEPAVYGTHHIGASTDQASEAVGDEVVHIISHWIASGVVRNCVNLARSSAATHMLVVRHADRVGVLAEVLERLKEAGINVQEMENIIFQGGLAACARIRIGGRPTPATIQQISSSEYIFATSLLTLTPRGS